VGAELFHAGGRTGMTKLIVSFRNVANARNKEGYKYIGLYALIVKDIEPIFMKLTLTIVNFVKYDIQFSRRQTEGKP
jgi:hypothetical protein